MIDRCVANLERRGKVEQPPSDGRAQVALDANCFSISLARDYMGDIARNVSWMAESRVDDLRLIVSEIVTNSVMAHERVGTTDPIMLTAEASEDELIVTVVDSGGGFESHQPYTIPEPSDEQDSGFGLGIVAHYADHLNVERLRAGTAVTVFLTRV